MLWRKIVTYGIEKTIDLVEATRRMLNDAGFNKCDSFFGRRVSEGVLRLVKQFQEENYSTVVGRLIVALFSRIARGCPPTPDFLGEVRQEIEAFAKDEPYNDAVEKGRWIHKRYPTLWWAGDLHKAIGSMVPPKPDAQKFSQKFDGAPLVRDEPMDPPPAGIVEDEPLSQPRVVKLSEVKSLIREGKTIQAIKLYREATGKGLKESRDFVYELRDGKIEFVDDTPKPLFDNYGFNSKPPPADLFNFEKLDNYGSGFAFTPGRISGTVPLKKMDVNLNVLDKALARDDEETFDNKIENIEKTEEKMCSNSRIAEVIRGFCKNLESFTSLDVSNKAKTNGLVARHREIAELVRKAFADGDMDTYGYVRNLITVTISGGVTAQTYLYHHTTVPADDYKDRAQVAVRPSQPTPQPTPAPLPYTGDDDDDDDDRPTLPTPIIPPVFTAAAPTPPAIGRLTRVLNTSSMTRTQKGDGRLEVPHVWMIGLGWQIGDTVSAVRDGNSLILKTFVQPGERVVRQFTVDRWNRIRITTKVLNEAGLHLGTGGQHIMTLRTGDIKID